MTKDEGHPTSSESLVIPYHSPWDVILRDTSSNALVLVNRDSNEITIESDASSSTLTPNNCPYCRRPFIQGTENEASFYGDSPFMDRDYFRILDETSRLAAASGRQTPIFTHEEDGIKSESFSEGYFEKFFVAQAELGRGGRGRVYKVTHVLDGVSLGIYALLVKVLNEVHLLRFLRHENLVNYNHVWLETDYTVKFGPSVPCVYILQQFCNLGDLESYIRKMRSTDMPEVNSAAKAKARRRSRVLEEEVPRPGNLPFDLIYSFFVDITRGLSYLHSNKIIHRDLKPSNCLLSDDGHNGRIRCLVSDFGESQFEFENDFQTRSGATGTIAYTAPEVLRVNEKGKLPQFSHKADLFSLGLLLHFLSFGRLPYRSAEDDFDDLRIEVTSWVGFDGTQVQERDDLPDELYVLLAKLLSVEPSSRPEATEVLNAIAGGQPKPATTTAEPATSGKHRRDSKPSETRDMVKNTRGTSPLLQLAPPEGKQMHLKIQQWLHANLFFMKFAIFLLKLLSALLICKKKSIIGSVISMAALDFSRYVVFAINTELDSARISNTLLMLHSLILLTAGIFGI